MHVSQDTADTALAIMHCLLDMQVPDYLDTLACEDSAVLAAWERVVYAWGSGGGREAVLHVADAMNTALDSFGLADRTALCDAQPWDIELVPDLLRQRGANWCSATGDLLSKRDAIQAYQALLKAKLDELQR